MESAIKKGKVIKEDKPSGIKTKCPHCGHVCELGNFEGWCFIILKTAKCEICGGIVTHDDTMDEE